MPKVNEAPVQWPPSIANWLAFESKEPWLATEEFPLFTDAWVSGETATGPYRFLNTVAFKSGAARPAIVLRYAIHKAWDYPDCEKTNTELYHGGSPQQELAALASLAMGIRLRAGHSTRRFEPNGDPFGMPTEFGKRITPYFHLPVRPNLPSAAAVGERPLEALSVLNCLPKLSQGEACAIVRASRLYQDGLWLAESEPEMTWLCWSRRWRQPPMSGIKNREIRLIASGMRSRSFTKIRSICYGISSRASRETDNLKKALKSIYGYRSDALHDGRPFPLPMCEAPRLDSSWPAPAEKMFALAVSHGGGVWKQKDIPMNLHLFEYITRNVLIGWLEACARKGQSS